MVLTSCKAVKATSPIDNFSEVIEITVAERAGVARHKEPVTSGLPFPEQLAIKDLAQLTLTEDPVGRRPLPANFKVLQRWDNGGIKWVLLDFQASITKPGATRRYYLHTSSVTTTPSLPVMARQSANYITVDTGTLKFVVSKDKFRLFDSVWLDLNGDGQYDDVTERIVSSGMGAGPFVWDSKGAEYTAERYRALPRVTLEENNPLRAVIKIEGRHQGGGSDELLSYIIRIHAFRGKGYVKVLHTFINNDIANPMRSVGSNVVKDIGLQMNLNLQGKTHFAFGLRKGKPFALQPSDTTPVALLFQSSSNNFSVARAKGLVEKLQDARQIKTGKRAWGWADIRNARWGLSVAVRNFWQQHPKAISLTSSGSGGMTIHFWPKLAGPFKLAEGLAKTHELLFIFHAGLPLREVRSLAASFNQPLMAIAPPTWYADSNAFGYERLAPARPDLFPHFEDAVRNAVEPGGFFSSQEKGQGGVADLFGMLNFGDYGGREWHNNEYDNVHNMLMQFVRTGDLRFLTLGNQMAIHYADVDIRHSTSKHFNHKHGASHTSGYWEVGHFWIQGLIDHYYLTGYRRSMDVALEWGHWLPKEIPYPYKANWAAVERNVGWPLIALMSLHAGTTGTSDYDPIFLKTADLLVHEIALPMQYSDIAYGRGVTKYRYPGCYVSINFDGGKKNKYYYHRSCTPWFTGILMEGLRYYHMATGDEDVKASMLKAGEWLLRGSQQNNYFDGPLSSFLDPAGTLRFGYPYRWLIFQDPSSVQPWSNYKIRNDAMLLSPLAYLTSISSNSRYMDLADKLFDSILYNSKYGRPPTYNYTKFTHDKDWGITMSLINYYLYVRWKNQQD